MTVDHSKQENRKAKAQRTHPAEPQATQSHAEQTSGPLLLEVERSGDWMDAEEMRQNALAASNEGRDVTVNLGNIDHLDGSALQILLALEAEQKRQGRNLQLANASEHLRQWFEYAGVADHFSMIGARNDE
jgi:anti-anti-sigma factor